MLAAAQVEVEVAAARPDPRSAEAAWLLLPEAKQVPGRDRPMATTKALRPSAAASRHSP
jgi:hypothetical protein